MPNTEPALDSQAAAEFVYLQAERAGNANVFPIGAVTKGRKGKELAEIGGLVEGGAVAFTDDGSPVVSAEIMRRALEYCRMFDKAVLSHCEDLELTRGGVMNEGFESMRLGLRGMPGRGRGDHDLPRHRPGRADRRPAAHPARLDGRRRRSDPPRQGSAASASPARRARTTSR